MAAIRTRKFPPFRLPPITRLMACFALTLTLSTGAHLAQAQGQTGWSPQLDRLLRDVQSAATDPAIDSGVRTTLVEEAKAGFDAMMVPAMREIARMAGKDQRVTIGEHMLTSPSPGNSADLLEVDGQWAWEFISEMESGELEPSIFGFLRGDAMFSFAAQILVDPGPIWIEDELTRYKAGAGAELVTVGNSERAVLEWFEDEDKSQYAIVTWMRGTDVVHWVQIRVDAPTSKDRKVHAMDVAQAVDAILERNGIFGFPLSIGPKQSGSVLSLEILDANPIFSPGGRTMPKDLRPTQLISASTVRNGTTADGVSQLIVRAEISDEVPVTFEIDAVADEPDAPKGSLTPLLDGRTVTLDGRHYAFALYTPPEMFDAPVNVAHPPKSPLVPPRVRLEGGLEVRELEIWASAGGDSESEFVPMALARPPVVLVHGVFSDPIEAWVRTLPDGYGMAALLERAGFLPFLVNYQDSNGWANLSGDAKDSFLFDAKDLPYSTFKDNYRVVWDSPRVDHTPIKYEYGFMDEKPILSELQKPKNTRIGGISQALEHYRTNLNLAATQAIVVGHSMGGILARVWASEAYNPTYRRRENFMQGDIDRLLTLNTPHHGSELVELKDAFLEVEAVDEDWTSWARRQLANTLLNWFMDPESGAIHDLRPNSAALVKIGKTTLPVYAIATKYAESEAGVLSNDPYRSYQALYTYAGAMFFNNRPMLNAFVQKRFEGWNAAPSGQRKTTDWNGKNGFDLNSAGSLRRYQQTIQQAIDDNVYYWAARRAATYQDELRTLIRNTVIAQFGIVESSMGNDGELESLSPYFIFGNKLTGIDISRSFDDSRESDVPGTFQTILRNLLFHNDPNTDGAVRVESQIGDTEAYEVIDNVLHSYAPWDYRVQRRVLFLLRGESARFDPKGFPAAGRPLPRYLPSSELSDARVKGAEAVAWSGMVPAHAQQFLQVADAQNVIVMVRPVNAASTKLLAGNAAAKGMNVKGKSANWGPQVGLIAFDQRYSKLWRVVIDPDRRRAEIAKYNKETIKSTTQEHPDMPGRHYAVTRPLQGVQTQRGACDVLTDPKAEDAETGVVFYCSNAFFKWQNGTKNGKDAFDPGAPLVAANVDAATQSRLLEHPMLVLADDTSRLIPRPYLTADYDLLAIGFEFEDAQCDGSAPADGGDMATCRPAPTDGVKNAAFDPLRGFISPRQKSLVADLNAAVCDNTSYTGGLVTHHGPENQYPRSPYVDYPILVFDPMQATVHGDGEVYLVRQGPPGFRDIHLKRLFAEKNRMGYNLWPNPASSAWRWNERRPFEMLRGYDPRDAANLPPYVDEAPGPDAAAIQRVEAALNSPAIVEPCPRTDNQATVTPRPPASGASEGIAAGEGSQDRPGEAALALPEEAVLPNMEQPAPAGFDFFDTIRFIAAQNSVADSQFQVGEWYEFGYRVPKDPAVALGWYVLAARQGDSRALLKIGNAYQFGSLGLSRDKALAGQWIRSAAEHGSDFAQWDLGEAYLAGDGLGVGNRDPEQALKWLKLAADQGLEPAQAELGYMYSEGYQVRQDFNAARLWLERAAKQGAGGARVALGTLYRQGKGGPIDYSQAEHWYRKAAEDGYSEGFYQLGNLYEQIEYDTKIGAEQSIQFLTLAANQGHVKAQFRLGFRYEWGGSGLAEDSGKALYFLTLAADQGHVEAMANLGLFYELGMGGVKNYEKAATLYQRAAERGSSLAQSQLGYFYQYGLGVKRDLKHAVALMTKAAEQNDEFALMALGRILSDDGNEFYNPARAHMYFSVSAALNYEDGAKERDALEARLTPEQREQALLLARDWQASHQ